MAVTLDSLSPAERKKLRADLRKEDKAKEAAKIKAKKEYQNRKKAFLKKAKRDGEKLQKQMIAYKTWLFKNASSLQEEMLAMGDISKRATKGGYTILSDDDSYKLTYQPKGVKTFDETVAIADEKLRIFLENTVKSTNKVHHAMINAILEKSKGGEYNPDLVNRLVQVREQIDHPEFDEIIKLFQDAWVEVGTTTYINQHKREGLQQSWEHISFQLSQLPILE